MAVIHYFVMRDQGRWLVKLNNQEYGPYRNQSEAVLCAIDGAEKVNEHGENAQVVLLDEHGLPATRLDLQPGREPRVLVSLPA